MIQFLRARRTHYPFFFRYNFQLRFLWSTAEHGSPNVRDLPTAHEVDQLWVGGLHIPFIQVVLVSTKAHNSKQSECPGFESKIPLTRDKRGLSLPKKSHTHFSFAHTVLFLSPSKIRILRWDICRNSFWCWQRIRPPPRTPQSNNK